MVQQINIFGKCADGGTLATVFPPVGVEIRLFVCFSNDADVKCRRLCKRKKSSDGEIVAFFKYMVHVLQTMENVRQALPMHHFEIFAGCDKTLAHV